MCDKVLEFRFRSTSPNGPNSLDFLTYDGGSSGVLVNLEVQYRFQMTNIFRMSGQVEFYGIVSIP